ncbi:MAG: adenylate/guanylate cyclase domain-containing protein, partial [Proteobacteria bacterium]|nr:adenylate/guanylate cyclase domain-containing protein [Pseudomonadota bacterium]
MTARTLTVVFTDIKGFTERTSSSSRAEMLNLLDLHEKLLLPIIIQHGGRVVKTIGDAFLLTFESPTNAVRCGLIMQDTLRHHNEQAQEENKIEIRVAINTGEVSLLPNGDVFGETVNLASRLEGATEAGDVQFTESTYLAMNKSEVPTCEVGEFRFKGIPESIRVYGLMLDDNLDLYKKVVDTYAIDPNVELPEGAFSAGLLLSVEQQDALNQRPNRTGQWVFGAAVLLLICVGGYLTLGHISHRVERGRAATMLEEGRFGDALDLLVELRREYPTDKVVPTMVAEAAKRDVDQLCTEERFGDARQKITNYQAAFPYLDIWSSLERDTRLAEAESAGQGEVLALVSEYPNDSHIKYRAAVANIEANRNASMRLFLDLLESDPTNYVNDPIVFDHLFVMLAKKTDEGLQQVMGHHYFKKIRDKLVDNLYSTDRSPHLRRNAYAILQQQEPQAIDELNFRMAEFLHRAPGDIWERDKTFAALQALIDEGVTDEIKARIPAQIESALVLSDHSVDWLPEAMAIVDALFIDALKDFLLAQLINEDLGDRGYRLNAYAIAKQNGWLTPELENKHFLLNLSDFHGEPRPHVASAIEYFAKGPKTPESKPLLEFI